MRRANETIPQRTKAFKWVVWFATALVAAIPLGVVAVLVFAWRSDAGDPALIKSVVIPALRGRHHATRGQVVRMQNQ